MDSAVRSVGRVVHIGTAHGNGLLQIRIKIEVVQQGYLTVDCSFLAIPTKNFEQLDGHFQTLADIYKICTALQVAPSEPVRAEAAPPRHLDRGAARHRRVARGPDRVAGCPATTAH